MTAVAATAAIVATGALVVLPTLPVIGRWGYAVMMVPSGFAAYFVVGTGLVAIEAFSTTAALAIALGAGLVGASTWWVVVGREQVRAIDVLLPVAVAAAAAAAVVGWAEAVDMTRLSPDSVDYLSIAGALERVGSLDPLGGDRVMARLIGIAMLHTPGVGGGGYMVAWTPLVGGAGLVLTGWLGSRAMSVLLPSGRWRPIVLGSVLSLTVTADRVLFDLFYINGHLAFATFLVLGVGSAWYATVCRCWPLLLPAALGFSVLPVFRPEGVIVALLFLVPLVVDDRLGQRHRWLLVLPFVGVAVLWYGAVVPPQVSARWLRLTGPVFSNLAAVGGLIGLVVFCGFDRLRRFGPWAVRAVPVVIAAYVAVRAARDWEPFTLVLSNMAANLAYDGMWTAFWWVTPLLFAMAVVVVRIPLQRVFVYPLATWPLALLLFSYLREGRGYRLGAGDSGNRMMMHVSLVLVLYLIAAAGAAAGLIGAASTGAGLNASAGERTSADDEV